MNPIKYIEQIAPLKNLKQSIKYDANCRSHCLDKTELLIEDELPAFQLHDRSFAVQFLAPLVFSEEVRINFETLVGNVTGHWRHLLVVYLELRPRIEEPSFRTESVAFQDLLYLVLPFLRRQEFGRTLLVLAGCDCKEGSTYIRNNFKKIIFRKWEL